MTEAKKGTRDRQSELENEEKEIICKRLECYGMNDSDSERENSKRRHGKDIKIYIVGKTENKE